MTDTPSSTELWQLRAKVARLRDEAAADRKAAAADREAAEYDRGQAEHRLRTVQATEAGISKREAKLKELGEPAFLEREAAAADKLKRAEELMASYQRDKHAAMIYLRQEAERDAAKRKQSAA